MTEPISHDVTLSCSVSHAFEVFTQKVDLWWPKHHRRFERSTLHHTVCVGGQLVERAETGEIFILADVLVCDPPHELILAWHPGKISNPTQTQVVFSARGEHEAHVKVTHSEADADLGSAWPQRAALFSSGWEAVLTALEIFVKKEGS